jgi:FKBP-type peptidyl-prolyl cis-trans isomerase FkpA
MKHLYILLLSFVVISCGGDDDNDNSTQEIADYLAENNISEMPDENGLVVIIEEAGNDIKPTITSNVKVHYRGYYLDGEQFDSSYDRGQPANFNLQGVIQGWTLGIPRFGIGGKGKLIIPASLGYGANPPSGIRKNAVLIFDIELLDVDRYLEEQEVVEAERFAIETYLSDNNLNPQITEEGVYLLIDEEGSAEKPSLESEVTIHYKGYFLNGAQFDSSYDRGQPSTFELTNVIQGWQIGIPYFGRNGKGTIIVPTLLGYGGAGRLGIPPYTTLVFDIELIDFE